MAIRGLGVLAFDLVGRGASDFCWFSVLWLVGGGYLHLRFSLIFGGRL